jgi:ankyrin repeat protein
MRWQNALLLIGVVTLVGISFLMWDRLSMPPGRVSRTSTSQRILTILGTSNDISAIDAELKVISDRSAPPDLVAAAAYAGRLDVLNLMLSRGFSWDGLRHDGLPLITAAGMGHSDCVFALLNRNGGRPPEPTIAAEVVQNAVRFGRVDCTVALINAGFPVGRSVPLNEGDFQRLARKNPERFRAAAPRETLTPLMLAAANDDVDMVTVLLNHGADKSAKSLLGRTARQYAELAHAARASSVLGR